MSKSLHFSALLLFCCPQARSQSSDVCNLVTYSQALKDFQNRIHILQTGFPISPPALGKKVMSTQGTRWFVEVDPDYMSTKVPWTTALYIGSSENPKVTLQALFQDHGNTFSAQWMNEDLLFVQVWWGRFASSDLILDVPKGRFIYNQFAHYSDWPCNEPKR